MMDFQNDVIPPDQLPRYESAALTPIDRRYRHVILWNWIFTVVIVASLLVLFFVADSLRTYKWIAVSVASILVLVWGLLQLKALARRSYAVRRHDIIFRHGILSVSTTIIPFNRIQHVAVREGPISRLYGLAAVHLYTAGGSAADLRLNGLRKETAESIKQAILERI